MACLREPSLGPCFGMKGGAAGGGYAQVVPMEDINLHFTGDFHAVTSANNLLSAMIDNHIYWGNKLGVDPRRIAWRRVLDMNDRALRSIVNSLGGVGQRLSARRRLRHHGRLQVMAILCLSTDLKDLERRCANIIIGQTREHKNVTAGELNASGAMSGAAARRADAEPGADAGEQSGVRAWRAVRQHRAWLQFDRRHQGRAQALRLRRHRSRVSAPISGPRNSSTSNAARRG